MLANKPKPSAPTRSASLVAALSALLTVAGAVCTSQTTTPQTATFGLSSPDSQLGRGISEVYTAKAFGCSDANLSPPLHWTGAPSLSGWRHWVVSYRGCAE